MIRTALYLGFYPSIILINEDFDEFKTKFKEAETYVIPSTDLLTFFAWNLNYNAELQNR